MKDHNSSVSVALAGSGGAGVMTAGNMLLEAAAAAGYYGLMTRTSGPQIRGGEAAAMVRVSTFPTDAQDDRFQVLAAMQRRVARDARATNREFLALDQIAAVCGA